MEESKLRCISFLLQFSSEVYFNFSISERGKLSDLNLKDILASYKISIISSHFNTEKFMTIIVVN